MQDTTIPLAITASGEIITPAMGERGKACNAVCLVCGRPVINRKGSIRIHHFVHKADNANAACNPESALHKGAKEIIQQSSRLLTPDTEIEISNPRVEHLGKFLSDATTVIPDITVWDGKDDLHIEIFVTHRDPEKIQLYAAEVRACMEIDLSTYLKDHGPEIDLEHLQKTVCSVPTNRVWLHKPQLPWNREGMKLIISGTSFQGTITGPSGISRNQFLFETEKGLEIRDVFPSKEFPRKFQKNTPYTLSLEMPPRVYKGKIYYQEIQSRTILHP
jgi:hypothetical protein